MSWKHFSQKVYLSENKLGVGFLKENISFKNEILNQFVNIYILVFVVEIFAVSSDGAELLAVAAESLRTVGVFPATAEAETLHHRVNLSFKYLGQLELKVNKRDCGG